MFSSNDDDDDNGFDNNDEKIALQDVASVARTGITRVYDSGSNLVITQFVYMLDKTIDLITYFTLGYRSLNSVEKEEIIKNLTEKRDILMHFAYDPKSQKIIRDMCFALGNVLSEIIDSAAPTIMKVQEKLSNSIGGGFDKVSARAMASLRNMIRIIPGAGDAFIIMENIFKIGQVATDIGRSFASSAETFTDAYKDISNMTKGNPIIKEQMNFFSNSAKEFEHIRNNISKKIDSKMPSSLGDAFDEGKNNIKYGIDSGSKNISSSLDSARQGLLKQHVKESSGGSGKKKLKNNKNKNNNNKHKKRNLKKYVFRSRKKCVKINIGSRKKK
jgi:hypothetical protein